MAGAKRIAVLGSTGSIGSSTLDVVRKYPERFRVEAIVAGSRWEALADLAREFRPRVVGLADADAAGDLQEAVGKDTEVIAGADAALEVAGLDGIDLVVNGLVGSRGLLPTLAALENGTPVALANKEVLVVAGELVMEAATRAGARLFPLDSELSAIHQCLRGNGQREVRSIILTASGGPFRERSREEFASIRPEDALRHPTWDMGPKVTVDSATLMNKGLEIIETRWYFDVPYERIEVVVHPQSIVHSMVEFVDHSVMAQMSAPDMRLPIQYALTFPERMASCVERFKPARAGALTFEEPDPDRFPCLRLAREAGEAGGTAPAVLDAANEMAVEAFLAGVIPFPDIPAVIEECLTSCETTLPATLENLRAVNGFTREEARRVIATRAELTRATGHPA